MSRSLEISQSTSISLLQSIMNNNNKYGQGSQDSGRGQQHRGLLGINPLGFAVKGIAAGIGLASESIHDRQEKKAAKKAGKQLQSSDPSENSGDSSTPQDAQRQPGYAAKKSAHQNRESGAEGENEHPNPHLEEGDEEQWNLDDAQDELIMQEPGQEVNPKNRPFERDPVKIAMQFINDYPLPKTYNPQGRLTLPVVLPQRRPKDRTRGFIRAYAPELMNNGIDQSMFLDFIKTFDLSTQASPWLNAINLAGLAMMPLHLSIGITAPVSIALALTVSLLKNMQSRKRYHTVLDKFNEEFYQPRGLYCMVLTWKPETDALEVGINVNETIHGNMTPPEGLAKTVHNYKPSMGSTKGVAFTETAPLVFPDLDKLDDNNTREAKTTKAKLSSAMGFAGEYFDRRAQAKYAAESPESQLVVGPKPTFTSRYSDPNHPSNNGDILSLITAGKLSMGQISPAGQGMSGNSGAGSGSNRGFGGIGSRSRGGIGRSGFGSNQSRHFLGGGSEVDRSMGGGPLGMLGGLTGGRKGPGGPARDGNQTENTQDQYTQQNSNQQMGGNQRGGMIPNPLQLVSGGVKRILSHHVLYLLIVNMPTEQEMADATKLMEQMELMKHEQK